MAELQSPQVVVHETLPVPLGIDGCDKIDHSFSFYIKETFN